MRLLKPKGYITSPFGAYESVRSYPHTGVDIVQGFKKSLLCVLGGTVAYIQNDDNPDLNQFRAIFTISQTDNGLMEICYGHILQSYVDVGDEIPEGLAVAQEGNTGEMTFMNGHQVTLEEKEDGDGSHLHLGLRPVVLDSLKIQGEHYRPYKFNGKFVRVALKDNGYNGCINPAQFFYTPTLLQLTYIWAKVAGYISSKLNEQSY